MICKVCGAKIPDGMTACDLCGAVVGNSSNNESNNTKKPIADNQINFDDPFEIDAGDKDNNSDKFGDEAADYNTQLKAKDTKTQHIDPFFQDKPNKEQKTDCLNETAGNNVYNFKMQSENSNYGASNKAKMVIGVLVATIAVAVAVIIILCAHIKNTIEDKSKTETASAQESINNPANETVSELNQEELFNAYSTDDIISFETINSDALIPNSTPEYGTYFDEEYNYMIDYPAAFQERYISGNKAMRIKYANENDSAILSVYACNNLENISTAELQNRIIEIYGGNVTYSPLKDNWFALSVNDDVFYHYAYFKIENQIIKGFEFHFSGEGNLDTYSKYIEHIYASFKKI